MPTPRRFVAPAGRRAYERVRLHLARVTVDGGHSLPEVFRSTLEAAATTLQVERVGIWMFIEERRALRCFQLLERTGRVWVEGAVLHRVDMPIYFRALDERREIPADDAWNDPATAELRDAYLVPLGITSLLDAPIYRGGQVVGVVCHEHIGPARRWSTEDRAFAASVADMLALRLEEAARCDAEARLRAQHGASVEQHTMEALVRLVRGGLHDVRNALTLALWSAREILELAGTSPAVAAEAQRIVDVVEQATAITQELDAFGRDDRHAPAVIDPGAEIERLGALLSAAAGRRHPIELERRSAVGRVLMDRTRLGRILLNLVLNARDAMPDGGAIRIVVREVVVGDRGNAPSPHVVIAVTDSGTGMSASTRARIFEPFFTTKAKGEGTGLGLAVVYSLVERAGGFLHVDTTPGKGTTFRVYLPRIAAAESGVTVGLLQPTAG